MAAISYENIHIVFKFATILPIRQPVLKHMTKFLSSLYRLCGGVCACADALIRDEGGQDLVEYALVVALIALGATASMSSLASSFSTAMSAVGNKLSTYSS